MELTVTVHVVDDDEAVRESLCFLLELEGMAVQTYESASLFLQAEISSRGCVLTDFRMPGMDGLQLQAALSARNTLLPVVIMTGHGDVPMAVRAMKAGAVDFLEKPFADTQLLSAVHRALNANRRILQAAADCADAVKRIALLTLREHEVLTLLVDGKSSKEIANRLGTSPRTIDVHRARVFQKLQADTLPDLVRLVLAAEPPH